MASVPEHRRLLEQGFALLDKVPTLHERAGTALGWLGRRRLRQATAILRRCHELAPDDVTSRLGLGRALHAAAEMEAALVVLEGAQPPGLPEIDHEVALLAMARGDAAKAETRARAALEARPSDVDYMVDYALALVLAKQAKRALGVITNACKLAPEHVRTRPVLELVRRVLDGAEAPPDRFAAGD